MYFLSVPAAMSSKAERVGSIAVTVVEGGDGAAEEEASAAEAEAATSQVVGQR